MPGTESRPSTSIFTFLQKMARVSSLRLGAEQDTAFFWLEKFE